MKARSVYLTKNFTARQGSGVETEFATTGGLFLSAEHFLSLGRANSYGGEGFWQCICVNPEVAVCGFGTKAVRSPVEVGSIIRGDLGVSGIVTLPVTFLSLCLSPLLILIYTLNLTLNLSLRKGDC